MFGRNSHRTRSGAAVLLAGGLVTGGLSLVGSAQLASAAPICDIVPERCLPGPTFSADPYGGLDAPTFGPASVRITGWATDPNAGGPIDVIVTLDGAVLSRATALLYRDGVGNRGFDVTVPASPASRQVCVTAVNVGGGSDASIGCASFPYSTDVTLLDQCGTVSLPLTAAMWRLAPPAPQVLQETTTSSGGRVGFITGRSIPGSLVGMSLGDGVAPGPLFRSGSRTELPLGSPDNPGGRLNLAVPCPSRFTALQLDAMANQIPITPPAGVTITSRRLVPGTGAMTLTLTGTLTGRVGLIPYTEPFTYTLTFTVSPSTDVSNTSEIVVVTPTGPGALTFTGGMGWFLNPFVAPGMEPGVTASVRTTVQNGLNSLIATEVARTFPGGLPAGATTSAARIVITPSGASLTPAVGWFG